MQLVFSMPGVSRVLLESHPQAPSEQETKCGDWAFFWSIKFQKTPLLSIMRSSFPSHWFRNI